MAFLLFYFFFFFFPGDTVKSTLIIFIFLALLSVKKFVLKAIGQSCSQTQRDLKDLLPITVHIVIGL